MSRAILIPIEGLPFEADIPLDYPAVNAAVVGGENLIERVRVNPEACAALGVPFGSIDMLVDEEGLVKDLPVNVGASAFYVLDHSKAVICGPAALVGVGLDDEGGEDWIGLPESITAEAVLDWSMRIALANMFHVTQ